MPQEIIDIALQHHGTSLLKFFLYKAKEEGKDFDEAKFRYPGPKPQTKEAAVISVADSVEAAVRSMKEPNAEKKFISLYELLLMIEYRIISLMNAIFQ